VQVQISARARREILAAATWWREKEGNRVKDARVIVFQRTGYLLFYRVVEREHVRVLTLQHGRAQL
jgi:hypothetical protein